VNCGVLVVAFLGLKIFLGFEIYFWVGVEKQRQLLVAPPYGLCSGPATLLRAERCRLSARLFTARVNACPSV
jgi:hypothetical protein